MDGVVAILQRANQLPTNEEGEVELDLRWVLGGGAGGLKQVLRSSLNEGGCAHAGAGLGAGRR